MAKPVVLLPALIGAVISAFFSLVVDAASISFRFWNMPNLTPAVIGLLVVGGILALIGGIISYIMAFASLDMSRDAYLGRGLSLGESIGYVFSRILTFIAASIVAVILAITIILIPVVLLMFIVIVVDEVGIGASISRAFNFVRSRLVDVLILIAIGIVGNGVLSAIPFLGVLLNAAFNVLLGLAYIDLYMHYKGTPRV